MEDANPDKCDLQNNCSKQWKFPQGNVSLDEVYT